MKICGIVCEYNPFHLGHLHQITHTREILGADTVIICCMSGNFVQRGEGAIIAKQHRAKMAILGGADLVVQLPTPFALSSAEGFASGAVSILGALGATHISFGAEHASSADLLDIASVLLEKATVEGTIVHMQEGISYAKARERALYDRIKEKSQIISQPNNILAVEYCKAILSQGLNIIPVAIQRVGAVHDGAPIEGLASASHIRQLARNGALEQTKDFLPPFSYEILADTVQKGEALLDMQRLECAMLSRLLLLEISDLAELSGASEGLEHRLYAAIHKGRSMEDICATCKTRRYAASRIRRMLMCAYLGIKAEETAALPQYIRVLALNDIGRGVLAALRCQMPIPVITKSADGKMFLSGEARYTDLYTLTLPGFLNICWGSEWKEGIFYKKQEKC